MKPLLLTLISTVLVSISILAQETRIQTLAIGSDAPNFDLPGVDGRRYTLNDFSSAKILGILFTCNHCPTAQYYDERIKQLVDYYTSKGFALVAISPNDPKSVRLDELGYTDLSDSFEEMKVRAKHKQYNFPYLYDGDIEEVSRAYGPTATPHLFLFDAQRKLRYVGRIDDSEREQYVKTRDAKAAIEALLAGREVEVKQTKAFGCSIKWAGKTDSVNNFMAKLAAEPVAVELADASALKALRKNDSGKLRLVNFWATWCGPCITEFPDLVTINRMCRHRAFEMVTVAANFPDEKKEVLAFLQKQQASNKNLLFATNEKYALMEAFDPDWNNALPYTMLIAPGGEVLYKHQGSIDALELRRIIVKSLKEDRFK
ncbi:MAG: redoxin domain-containing protein [Verrucomicrobia bacterium]|nr:redoxin domain-containing protein [Verrucomicrobiota bacterium]